MKKILIVSLVAIILLGGGGAYAYAYSKKIKEDKFLSSNSQTKESYEIVKKRTAELKKNPSNYDAYMSLAFSWKGIGEVTKNDKYLKKAARVYDAVIRRWGNKAYLPFYNQANVYIELKEYEKAENNLKISLEIDMGEQNLYVALADLYKDYMKKDSKEIKAVYEKGIMTVVGGGNLVNSYASYFNEIGDYKNALKYYKMLKQAYPTYSAYDDVIKELESKVQ